jgi:hypothetical protein
MAPAKDIRSEGAEGRLLTSTPGAGWAAFAGLVIAIAGMREGARQISAPMVGHLRRIDLLETVFLGSLATRLLRRMGARAFGA